MPRATVDQSPGEKIDLKSCPGGYVILQRLSYGQKIARRELSTQLTMDIGKKAAKKDPRAELAMLQQASTMFDYSHCLVDHNLEDASGNKLNLHNAHDVNSLDPKVGEEIETLIDDLNNFEEELETAEGNS